MYVDKTFFDVIIISNLYILFYSPTPDISVLNQEQYDIAIYVLGGTHNFFCLLLFISYFVGNHPRLPKIKNIVNSVK